MLVPKHATLMILGKFARACAFCNIKTGRPDQLDPHEPEKSGACRCAIRTEPCGHYIS